jgi:hypothetical protein
MKDMVKKKIRFRGTNLSGTITMIQDQNFIKIETVTILPQGIDSKDTMISPGFVFKE